MVMLSLLLSLIDFLFFYFLLYFCFVFFFFFQAEDGIRDTSVTGVQTCALPISIWSPRVVIPRMLTSQCGYRRLSSPATCSDCHIASRLLRDAMTIRSESRLNSRP